MPSISVRAVAALFIFLGGALASPAGALAQEQSGKWTFRMAPYLWATSVKGTSGTLPPAAPVEVDASFRDIVKNLDFGFMMYGSLRYERWGFDLDLFYSKISASGESPRQFLSGKLKQKMFFATPGLVYRITDAGKPYEVELFAGARIWSINTDFTLSGPRRSISRDYTETWVDPLIGIQGRLDIGDTDLYMVGWAKVGGFGIGSRVTYDIFAGLGYQIADWVSAVVGYRHLYVNRRNDGFVFDAQLTGPVLGAVFKFSTGP